MKIVINVINILPALLNFSDLSSHNDMWPIILLVAIIVCFYVWSAVFVEVTRTYNFDLKRRYAVQILELLRLDVEPNANEK